MCPIETRRSERGIALAMVLAMLVVMFILGVTVGGLSTNNARMVKTAQDRARARQAAWAAQVAAQCILDSRISRSSSEGETFGSALIPTDEIALPDPDGDGRACAWYRVEAVPDGGARSSSRVTIRSTGYLKNDDGSRRAATVVTVRYHRAEGAFRYAVQAAGAVTLEGPATVSAEDDVAIRTNAAAVDILGGGVIVQGDILVGPSGLPLGLTNAGPAEVAVAPAPAAAALQVVTPPSLQVRATASEGALGGCCDDIDAVWEIDANWEYVTVSFGGTDYKLKGRVADLGLRALLGLPVKFTDSNGAGFSFNPSASARRQATDLTNPDPCPLLGEWRRSRGGVEALGPWSGASADSPDSNEASVGTGAGNSITLYSGSIYPASRDSRLRGAKVVTMLRRADIPPFRPAQFQFDSFSLKNCTLRLPPGQTVIYVTNRLALEDVTVVSSSESAPGEPSGRTPSPQQNPCNLLFLGTSECSQVSLTGGSLAAAIYAPQAAVTLSGVTLNGSVVGGTVRCKSHASVTYDPRLKVLSYEGLGVVGARWVQEQ